MDEEVEGRVERIVGRIQKATFTGKGDKEKVPDLYKEYVERIAGTLQPLLALGSAASWRELQPLPACSPMAARACGAVSPTPGPWSGAAPTVACEKTVEEACGRSRRCGGACAARGERLEEPRHVHLAGARLVRSAAELRARPAQPASNSRGAPATSTGGRRCGLASTSSRRTADGCQSDGGW